MLLRLTTKMGKTFKIKPQTPDKPSIKQKSDNLVFDFAELRPFSYVEAKREGDFFIKFLERLKKLGSLDWNTVNASNRHSFGGEKMKSNDLTPSAKQHLPAGINSLTVLRATGDNHAFLGIRDENVFRVIFIEYQFGDVYKHSH